MKRKVIKQGHNTLTVTLPSKWVKNQGVKPGDDIDVEERETSLLLHTAPDGAIPSSIVIDISNLTPSLIWRYVSSAYRAGFDEIMVNGIDTHHKPVYSDFSYNTLDYLKGGTGKLSMSPLEAVNAIVNRLVGMEIIEQKPNYCLVKDMSEVTDKEFKNALRRIFTLLQTEMESIGEGFKGRVDGLKSINLIDSNLDRFEDFCFRVLNKKGYTNSMRKTNIMHSIIFILELIGDELKKIAIHMLEGPPKYTDFIKELFRHLNNQVNTFYRMFYKFDKNLAIELHKVDKDCTGFTAKHFKKLNDREKELVHHLKKVFIHVMSLTELRIDMEF